MNVCKFRVEKLNKIGLKSSVKFGMKDLVSFNEKYGFNEGITTVEKGLSKCSTRISRVL